MLKLKFLGAAGTVTGSRTLITFNKSHYLVDCGLFQGPKEIRMGNWESNINAQKLDGIILTHAHVDHSGYLPKVVKDGYRGPIYCSDATADLCKILLPDAGFLQEEDARFANMKKYSHHDPALPLYTERDAERSLQFLKPKPMDEWVHLDKGLSFRFIRAGHILGSSFVQFSYESKSGSRLLTFSGDIGNGRSHILKDPTQITETDELILESTYGDRVQPREDEKDLFANIINKVLKRGGTLVIPAFAVGRTQELLYLLHLLEKDQRIAEYPVYLDSPMALDATDLYLKYGDELKPEIIRETAYSPLRCTRFIPVRSSDESMLLCMSDEPKIVISAAGMLTGGRIMHHLKTRLPKAKNGVLFVGYQVPGTKGYLLKQGLQTINIHHQKVDVEAEIFALESLSAHADSNDLVKWVQGFTNKPKTVFLNHGEKIALESLRYRLRHEVGIEATVVSQNDEFTLD